MNMVRDECLPQSDRIVLLAWSLLGCALLLGCAGSGGTAPVPPSQLSYPAIPVTSVGTSIGPFVPTVTGSVSLYSAAPSLPAGLTLDPTTGTISGTPSVAVNATYTITAGNSAGNTTTAIALSVLAEGVLYSFSPTGDVGAPPNGPLIQGSDGDFYGTTAGQNLSGATVGTAFKITSTGQATLLWSFGGSDDGYNPGPLTRGADGYFYGITANGGAGCSFNASATTTGDACGTLFRLNSMGAEDVLWTFGNGLDGANPRGPLLQAADGNLYGTTVNGGTHGMGAVFRVNTSGQESVLYSFQGAGSGVVDGSSPSSGVIQGANGDFYGTTTAGGAYGYGTVFEVSPAGQENVLWSFGGNAGDGINPNGLILGVDGNFYGTTTQTRATGSQYYYCLSPLNLTPVCGGTVFTISPAGQEAVIFSFAGLDGAQPSGALALGPDGNFYGTTAFGGSGCPNYGGNTQTICAGVAFSVTSAGVQTVLWNFGNDGLYNSSGRPIFKDGINPYGGLLLATDGYFYGTTTGGGPDSYGVVFRLAP